jgi:hypothetical protein
MFIPGFEIVMQAASRTRFPSFSETKANVKCEDQIHFRFSYLTPILLPVSKLLKSYYIEKGKQPKNHR